MTKKVYFLSDLHLGAPYSSDARQSERKVVAFLDSIKEDASEIYLLGDILDYWYEYRYVVPRGFVRFFGKLAELTDSGIKVTWLIGNHDIWIFDYLPSELGVEVIDGSVSRRIGSHTFYMTHGDGIGKLKPSFRMLRALFRSRVCQKLFSGIHPRWTVPFAYNWSSHSRKSGAMPREEDSERLLKNVISHSEELLASGEDFDFFVYGHLHLMIDRPIGSHSRLVVLGEWIHKDSYGVYDGKEFKLKRWVKGD